MSTAFVAFCGVAAGVIKLVGLIPYVQDIFRHKTKPERATWWIWSLLNFVALVALLDAGASWQLGLNISQSIITTLIAVLSLTYGYGKFHKRDFASIIVAFIGVVLWQITDQPLIALLIVIAIDALAVVLTATKTWEAPSTETLSAWIAAVVGDFFGLLAVGSLSFTKMSYPLYLVAADGVMTLIIIYRRRALAAKAAL